MGGYWDMGKLYMARPPASMKIMAMTHAKTGRSRKKFDNIRLLRHFDVWDDGFGLTGLPPSGGPEKGTTFTEAPGRTLWSPSTIRRSPGARPEETSHWSPIVRSRVSLRC